MYVQAPEGRPHASELDHVCGLLVVELRLVALVRAQDQALDGHDVALRHLNNRHALLAVHVVGVAEVLGDGNLAGADDIAVVILLLKEERVLIWIWSGLAWDKKTWQGGYVPLGKNRLILYSRLRSTFLTACFFRTEA